MIAVATVFQVPSGRWLGAVGMLVAQVIGVRIPLGREIVEPSDRTRILIGQSDSCWMNTSLSRALTGHVENGSHRERWKWRYQLDPKCTPEGEVNRPSRSMRA